MKNIKNIVVNKYNEPRSGWIIVAGIILILMGQMAAGFVAPDMNQEPTVQVKLFVTAIYSIITIGGGILLYRVVYKKSLCHVGLVRKSWIKWTACGLGMGIVLMGTVFLGLLCLKQVDVLNVHINKLLSIGLLVEFASLSLTAFSEEFILRGLMMTALKTTRNPWVVIFIPTIIFSLIHLLNPGVTIISFINTFLGGLLFSYLFVQAGTLWLPVGFHIGWNFLQV